MSDLLFLISSCCDDEALTRLFEAGVDLSLFYNSDHWWLTRIGQLVGKSVSVTHKPERWKDVYHSLLYALDTSARATDKYLVHDPYYRINRPSKLQAAAVEILLQIRDPSQCGFYAFTVACLQGRVDIAKLMQADPRIDLSVCVDAGLDCVNLACSSTEESAITMTKFLLTNPIFDKSVDFWGGHYATMDEPNEAMKLVIEAVNVRREQRQVS